ncbi:LOW QUALITY PROTEIN: sarcosine oxidase [Bacillus sp. JCM 19047]|nr:LOW QUALITY PROTEIN: sarcosine oxidase [Bacillus sp. JCM 19047]
MHFDVIIIGAGSMGMAAGYFLAKSGKSTLLLDAHTPLHQRGSHHGETRMIRHAYAEGEQYVPFVRRAQSLWYELERESGKEIFLKTGVLSVGKETGQFIQETIKSAEKYDLPLLTLSRKEVHNRFPGMHVPNESVGCFESISGVLKCEDSITAYKALAKHYGATLLTGSRVTGVSLNNHVAQVHTVDETYAAHSVIISAGAWSGPLLDTIGLKLPLTPLRKTFAWFHADEQTYGKDAFPAFAYESSNGLYYGFPSIEGAGLKVGRHDGGTPIHPDEQMAPFGTLAEDEEDLRTFVHRHMPTVNDLAYGKTCLYTMTPDDRFIIDRHPQYKNLYVAAGFSGHGFKFSSAVGQALSQLVCLGETEIDISAFSLDRFQRK